MSRSTIEIPDRVPSSWASVFPDLYLTVDHDANILSVRGDGRYSLRPAANLLNNVNAVDAAAVRAALTTATRGLRAVIAGTDSVITTYPMRDTTLVRLTPATSHAYDRRRIDPLTGLPNREAALALLDQMLSGTQRSFTAVLFCDLDGFKAINDTHGHDTGDQVLQQVATRLQDALLPGDVAARLGGDEFLVLCQQVTSQDDAEQRARRLRAQFTDLFTVDDARLWAGVSIGICLVADDMTAKTAIWNADVAMYEAKRLRAGITIFTPSLNAAARDRRHLEHDLRNAVSNGEMRVVYQPILGVAARDLAGCEALLRWRHPQRGDVPPSVFVPIAETMGIVADLGTFALRTATAQMRHWLDVDPAKAPGFVAVNVSAQQLSRAGFADAVTQALAAADIPADRLTLEITETALLSDPNVAVNTLLDLADLGISLDIDDFGSGYSNLAYLVRLPVHALKIDQSFIWELLDDERTQTTVEALLTLASALDLNVVAEGIERPEQLEWLAARRCTMAQGFHIARPLPGDDLLTWEPPAQTH